MPTEPTHIMTSRTTADSKVEGRLMVSGSSRRKKRKILKKILKKY